MVDVTARASGTCGNFGPGFDAMSLALGPLGDTVRLRDADVDEVRVTRAASDDASWGVDTIPEEWGMNAVGAVLDHLRTATGIDAALRVDLTKGVPPGSGLGSSASSSAAAALAFAQAFGPVDRRLLFEAALAGETRVAGAHRDDVAAALFGGLAVVDPSTPDVRSVAPPPRLRLAVLRPHVVLETRRMRAVLPKAVPLEDVAWNLSATARLVAAFHAHDVAGVGAAFSDRVAVPHRAPLVPGFDAARDAAVEAGAFGFGLSGSGPSMLAVCDGDNHAQRVLDAMAGAADDAGVPASAFVAHGEEVRDLAPHVR